MHTLIGQVSLIDVGGAAKNELRRHLRQCFGALAARFLLFECGVGLCDKRKKEKAY